MSLSLQTFNRISQYFSVALRNDNNGSDQQRSKAGDYKIMYRNSYPVSEIIKPNAGNIPGQGQCNFYGK